MASAVVSTAFRLPFATRRFSDSAPLLRSSRFTVGFGRLLRVTTVLSVSQQTGETGGVVDASRNDENSAEKLDDVVVQYVVLRRDLIDSGPLGSVVTQGCHASVAAIWSFKDDPVTRQYCDPLNIDSMHKVTLEVKGETQMMNLAKKLRSGGISHKLWMEQPENIPDLYSHKALSQISRLSFLQESQALQVIILQFLKITFFSFL